MCLYIAIYTYSYISIYIHIGAPRLCLKLTFGSSTPSAPLFGGAASYQ